MNSSNKYNLKVQPGTRNHKGYFVQDTTYKFMGVNQSGWAFICLDNLSCHYVDPDSLIALNEEELSTLA